MRRVLFGLVIAIQFGFGAASWGQTRNEQVHTTSASEIELQELIKTLQNEADREKLISQLNTILSAQRSTVSEQPESSIGKRMLGLVSLRIDSISKEFVAGARAIMDVPNIYAWSVRQISDDALFSRWLEICWKVALAVFLGLVGEWLSRRLLMRPRQTLENRQVNSPTLKLVCLLGRTILDVIPILGFLVASYVALMLVEPGELTQLVAFALINASVLARAVMASARLILAPAAPNLRFVPLRDLSANYLFVWVRRFTVVLIYGYFLIVALGYLGLSESGQDVLLKFIGLICALILIVLTLQNRANVAAWLRGDARDDIKPHALRARIADIWYVAIILYVIFVYSVWALATTDSFQFVLKASVLSALIALVGVLVSKVARRAVRRIFVLRPQIRQRYAGLEERANLYLPILENSISVIVAIVSIFALLEAWGFDASAWLATPLGQQVTTSTISLALLLAAIIVALEVASAAIERYLSRDSEDISARTRTLLPLLRTTLLVVLVTMFILVTLSELGLNIAPLLAGAGVFGLAIGFGAQTLVKDIITGMFILMEDQLATGDVVKVGSHRGIVEGLTLRTIRLRDIAGTVHVVPFSEVTTVENLTKDYSRYVFEVGVAYREDTDQVVGALQQVGAELLADPAYKSLIIDPLEVLGVDSFGDNAVIIKARITTQPIKQWRVGREFNRRMKKRFDELGIELPFPHRTIYFGEEKSGDAPIARIAMVDKNYARTKSKYPETAPQSVGTAGTAKISDVTSTDMENGD